MSYNRVKYKTFVKNKRFVIRKTKYGIYYGPAGLTKKEKEVLVSGKLPRRVKILVDSKFKGSHALFSGILGYKLENAITAKKKTWLIYKLA